MVKYSRKALAESRRYKADKDIILAVLEADKEYTLKEADAIINKFKKGKVR